MIASIDQLKDFCTRTFAAAGMDAEKSEICADALVTADAMGFHSHGVANAHGYIAKAKAGGVNFAADPEIVMDLPSLASVDGRNALGMVSSSFAMELACEKAARTGIAFVSVKHSCHFGAAGYYANIAARKGMLGLVFSNVDPNMSVPGSLGKAIGNNPIAFAVPARNIPSVFLDISTGATASLKVIQAKDSGELVPDGWIIDEDGMPTNDPSRYPDEGALQPMGHHKGYGLSVMVECLTGILTGCGTSTGGMIPSWCFSLDQPNNISHAFIVIDISQFCPKDEYAERIRLFSESVHGIPTVDGADEIRLPGEGAWARYDQAQRAGIKLTDAMLASIRRIESDYGIAFVR